MEEREAASRDLASFLGAEDLIVLILDRDTGSFVPAPGYPKTLPGRKGWKQLVRDCRAEGRGRGQVMHPATARSVPATAISAGPDSMLVLLAGEPDEDHLDLLYPLFPLLEATLRGEYAGRLAADREAIANASLTQLSQLATELDRTRERLQQALQEADRANGKMRQELSERRRVEEALQELNDTLEQRVVDRTAELEGRNKELREFAYVASHDLQEPLRKIMTFSDLLVTEYRSLLEGDALFYLERMDVAAQRMSGLITDLLSFSRVATRVSPVGRVDLSEVVREVIDDLEVRLQQTEGIIHVDRLPEIEADRSQMRQLFLILIGNALKFHRPGVPPEVHITCTSEAEGTVTLEVRDSGIGFDHRYSERMFLPFQRLQAQEDYDGTGMGLALCRRIVEQHAGSIEAEGESGSGATFRVRLPIRSVPSSSG